MGSGCTNSATKNACFTTTSSNCVQWVGEAVPSLNICTGDTLTEVEQVIINTIQTLIDGTGINLSILDLTCPLIVDTLSGKDKNLPNILQTLITSTCSLKSSLDSLTAQVNTPVTYNSGCLTPVGNNTHDVLQAAVDKLCSIQTTVNNLTNQLSNSSITTTINNSAGNFVVNNVSSCGNKGITKSGSGANATLTINALVPPFCPIFYVGSLSNFDSNGAGIANAGFCGWYICNGNNGTPDMRGWAPAGATNLPGINGPSLNPTVDPVTNFDSTYASNILDRKGQVKHVLSNQELPTINPTATIVDPGHIHTITSIQTYKNGHDCTINVFAAPGCDSPALPTTTFYGTNNGKTNITATISSFGANIAHENRQPTLYGVWIMRIS